MLKIVLIVGKGWFRGKPTGGVIMYGFGNNVDLNQEMCQTVTVAWASTVTKLNGSILYQNVMNRVWYRVLN